jgi:hypothetical protein
MHCRFPYQVHVLFYTCRYYNAWIETYGEQELKRLSGVDLSEEQSDSDDTSDGDDDQTNGISIEFRNETSPSEGSDSDSDSSLSDSELNPFHSTFNSKADDLDSFVTFEASAISGRGEDSQEAVFMNQFSDNSEEGGNILGNLESEVMNTSISRYKP